MRLIDIRLGETEQSGRLVYRQCVAQRHRRRLHPCDAARVEGYGDTPSRQVEGVDAATACQYPRGTQRRMSGERQLLRRSKDTHACFVFAFFDDKRRFREVHLARDSLHRCGIHVFALAHHRELVAG